MATSVTAATLLHESRHQRVLVESWSPGCVRVRVTLEPGFVETSPAVLPRVEHAVATRETEAGAELVSGPLAVRLSAKGALEFFDAETGAPLLRELDDRRARRLRSLPGGNAYRVETQFEPHPDERFFGLGQHRHGLLDQKGCVIDLEQYNTNTTIPFLVSSRGYGFFWNNPAQGRVELGHNATRWVAQRTSQIDYFVVAGPTYAEILERYAAITGLPSEMPHFATGFWQCKLRYRTQEEVLGVAREHRRRGLPMSVIVIDYFHWPMMGTWDFDPEAFPDPEAMVAELREMGIELMVSVWPTVNPDAPAWDEMEEAGYLVRTERGETVQHVFTDAHAEGKVYVQYYDATHPGAQEFLWAKIKRNYVDRGIKVFWLDSIEPDWKPHHDHDHVRYHLGNGEEVGNLYPLLHEQAFYEGLRAEGVERPITLCRSAWAGSQRCGASVWSGDIESSFPTLRSQVVAGLNMAVSGIPWWNSDIGGFKFGNPTDPAFRELLVRWFQFGCFCPIFRLHGVRLPNTLKSGADNEVWSFGDEAYPILCDFLHLRERLRPYIAEQMAIASARGLPPMRPLFFDFADDAATYGVADAYLFGRDLLVAPVVEPDARERAVYLPAGATWTDAWTGDTHAGGRWLTAPAPLERLPLFLRDGAELPILPPDASASA